jgi:predicted nucleic-acid-binding protein
LIALDTNVLVRYLVRDDPRQAQIAARLFQKLTTERPGYISSPVVVELVRVLGKGYGFEPSAIVAALAKLLEMPNLLVEDEDELRLATESDHGDFVDRWIHFIGEHAGCEKTVTFDRRFARLSGVELLKNSITSQRD